MLWHKSLREKTIIFPESGIDLWTSDTAAWHLNLCATAPTADKMPTKITNPDTSQDA